MKPPYRGMTRQFWQKGRFAKVAEEVHAVYLLEKWTKMEARNHGSVRRIFTGVNAVVWPERFRKVGYYYEMEKEVFKLKPQGRPLLSQVEQMFREEAVLPTGDNKEWE